ncbi:DinB family protein [Streptomyces albiaxialis]|uniref:DinB family protein n=1 Tax=Streptomyces albiaxialis TaxID=329523 RepID=A0ABN2WQI4_9ACTN
MSGAQAGQSGPSVPPLPVGEPSMSVAEPHALLEGYLDFCRSALLRKLEALPESELRLSSLPSGWTPLELVRHLTYVERRWLRWGFEAEQLPDPWGDRGPEDRWHVPAETTAEEVIEEFRAEAERSRKITGAAALGDRARTGGRFRAEGGEAEQEKEGAGAGAGEEEADGRTAAVPALSWILFHLLQEYARHLGHLDVVVELATRETGE